MLPAHACKFVGSTWWKTFFVVDQPSIELLACLGRDMMTTNPCRGTRSTGDKHNTGLPYAPVRRCIGARPTSGAELAGVHLSLEALDEPPLLIASLAKILGFLEQSVPITIQNYRTVGRGSGSDGVDFQCSHPCASIKLMWFRETGPSISTHQHACRLKLARFAYLQEEVFLLLLLEPLFVGSDVADV